MELKSLASRTDLSLHMNIDLNEVKVEGLATDVDEFKNKLDCMLHSLVSSGRRCLLNIY